MGNRDQRLARQRCAQQVDADFARLVKSVRRYEAAGGAIPGLFGAVALAKFIRLSPLLRAELGHAVPDALMDANMKLSERTFLDIDGGF